MMVENNNNNQARPFAVFDIDGTLIRWQLYHAMADAMSKQDIINSTKYQLVLQARENWKSRLSINSFSEYEESMIKLINSSIPGLDYPIFQQICLSIVNRYQNQVYSFTRDLIANLKKQGYLIFAISASPAELVSLVAKYYKFDDYGASTYEVKDNKLTGNKTILYGEAKTKKLNQLIASHRASIANSIGVGDTLGDWEMLNMTEKAIAFNPSKNLYDQALTKGWEIIIERKNVVYRLVSANGKYFLASAS